MVLDMTTNDIIYESLARSAKIERLSLTILASTLNGCLLTHQSSCHQHMIFQLAGLPTNPMHSACSTMHILVVTMLQFMLVLVTPAS